MGNEALQQFLLDSKTIEEMDRWYPRKVFWLEAVADFFKLIREDYLKEYIEKELLDITLEDMTITEHYIGTYTTEKMIIGAGENVASLTPIGTLLVGAAGRIDLIGEHRTIKFVLADITDKPKRPIAVNRDYSTSTLENEIDPLVLTYNSRKLMWRIASDPPVIMYREVDKDNFQSALLNAMNG